MFRSNKYIASFIQIFFVLIILILSVELVTPEKTNNKDQGGDSIDPDFLKVFFRYLINNSNQNRFKEHHETSLVNINFAFIYKSYKILIFFLFSE